MITEYKLEDAGREMLIMVKRSSRKTLGLEVRENGEIFARIPEKLSDRSLKSFIEKERDWIIKKSELVKWERTSTDNQCNACSGTDFRRN